jgi:hypothetical protein
MDVIDLMRLAVSKSTKRYKVQTQPTVLTVGNGTGLEFQPFQRLLFVGQPSPFS